MDLYPLKFNPRFVEKIWGGRKLESVLGKALPKTNQPYGESWELFDFPPGVIDKTGEWVSAAVANGPLVGRTLHSLVEQFGVALHGDVPLVGPHGQFPILIKFLDARDDLSLQVHPPADYAAKHAGAHLKTEAWYVMQHEPGARILKGIAGKVSRDEFSNQIKAGTVEQAIQSISVKVGDCHFLPSGTVHALGAGILAAEVQTPSDTTFRVFDFNRLENGSLRKLHIEESLECIDFSGEQPAVGQGAQRKSIFPAATRFVSCPFFNIDKVRLDQGVEKAITYDQPVVWMMLDGSVELRVEGMSDSIPLKRGETALLPARMNQPTLKMQSDGEWLEVTFPTE